MTHYHWKDIVKESVPPLVLAVIFSMVSGTVLDSALDLEELVAILLVVPAFINIAGDLGAVVSARVSTDLYMGKENKVWISVVGAMIVSFVLFILLGLVAEIFLELMGRGIGLAKYVSITLLAGILATGVMSGISLALEFLGRRLGVDPSDLSIPILSSLGDAMGVGFLILIARIIMGV